MTVHATADRSAPLDEAVARPRIAICVATYRRPTLLAVLLRSVASIRIPEGFDVELRIIDNDAAGTAEEVVRAAQAESALSIHYAVQPERNIALTRNAALDVGAADYLAFIDDDEWPDETWLQELLFAAECGADVVIGDVRPDYERPPPGWIRRGRFHAKGSGAQGAALTWQSGRTSNTLLRGAWIYEQGFRFDEKFGRSGGEDTHLFKRILDSGGRMVAAPRAVVTERVHRSQCQLGWLLARYWRNGVNYERLVAETGGGSRHPLVRFLGRIAVGLGRLVASVPPLLVGRFERCAAALVGLSRAAGGLVGWLSPERIERSEGYQSSGCEGEG